MVKKFCLRLLSVKNGKSIIELTLEWMGVSRKFLEKKIQYVSQKTRVSGKIPEITGGFL